MRRGLGRYPIQTIYRHSTEQSTTQSDHLLVTRARSGDTIAFGQLYRRHQRLAVIIASRICGEASAEDAVQAAFLSIWRNLGGYRAARGSVKNWLMSAVRNRSIDVLRAQARKPTHQSDAGLELEDPVQTETLVAERELAGELIGTLGRLPEDQGRVIFLAYFRGLSQTEISSRLGVPLGTVKGRVRLGLEKLTDELPGTREHHLAAA